MNGLTHDLTNSMMGGQILVLLTLMTTACLGDTIRWKEGKSGFWHTATNWDTNTVPGPQDSAIIDASGTYTVTVRTTTIRDVTVTSDNGTATLRFENSYNQKTYVHGDINIAGTLSVAQLDFRSLLILGGNVTVTGTFIWSGGSIESSGSLHSYGVAYIQAPKRYGYSYLRRASVHIHDACAFTHGTIYLDNGASLIVEKNAVFNFTDTADYLRSSNNHIGHFNNHGTFNAMRQGSIIIVVAFNNYGNINVANGSTLDIRTSSTSTGEVTVAEKGRLLFQGATHSLLADSVVKGQGRIDVYQATVRISSKIFQISTVRSYGNNGILYIKRVAGMDNLKSLSVSGRGKLYLSPSNATRGRPLVVDKVNMQQAGSIQLPGSVTIHDFQQSTSTGNYRYANTNLDIRGNLTLDGLWSWHGGILTVTGDVNIATSKGSFDGNRHKYMDRGRFIFNSPVSMGGKGNIYLRSGGRIINSKNNVITVNERFAFAGSGAIENHGTLNISNLRPGITKLQFGTVNNYGYINAVGRYPSTLEVTSQVTNFGKIHIPRNNTLYVTGTRSTIRCSEKGAITGSGTLHVNGADVLTNQIDVNRIQMDSGTLSMDDPRPVSTRMRTIRMTNGKLQFRASDAILEIDDLEIKSGTFETNRNTNIQNLQFLGGVITGEGDIKTVERFYWKSGTFSGGAQSLLNIQQYFQIDYSNVKRLRRRTFLSGVSKWVGTNLKLSIEHDFTINKGAMVMVYGDFLTLSTSTHNKGILVNNGRINCSLPLGSFNLGVDFRNYGELYLQEGSLALTQNSRIEGTIGLKENSDLVLQSGKHVFLDDISLKGNGTVTVKSGEISIRNFAMRTLRVEGGTAEINAANSEGQSISFNGTGGSTVFSGDADQMMNLRQVMLSGTAKLTVDVPARFEYLSLTGNSVLENSNVITVATEFRWVSGNIMGTWRDSAHVDVRGSLLFLGNRFKNLLRHNLVAWGHVSMMGSARFLLGYGSVFDMKDTSNLRVNTTALIGKYLDQTQKGLFAGTLMIRGNANIDTLGSLAVDLDTALYGTVSVQKLGELQFGGTPDLYGQGGRTSTDVKDMTTQIKGKIVIQEAATFKIIKGRHHFYRGSDLTGKGDFRIVDGEVKIDRLSFSGNIQSEGGKVTVLDIPQFSSQQHISVSGSSTLSIGVIKSSTKSMKKNCPDIKVNGGTLEMNMFCIMKSVEVHKGGSLAGAGNFEIGQLLWTGGNITGENKNQLNITTLVVKGSQPKGIRDRDVLLLGNADINGTGTVHFIESDFTIDKTATVTVNKIMELRTISSSLVNHGTILYTPKISFKGGDLLINAKFNHLGEFRVSEKGGLNLAGTSLIKGKIILEKGTRLRLSGSSHIFSEESSVKSDGEFVNIASTRMKSKSFEVSSIDNTGTLTVEAPLKSPKLTVSKGRVNLYAVTNVTNLIQSAGVVTVLTPSTFNKFEFSGGSMELRAEVHCGKLMWMEGTLTGPNNFVVSDLRFMNRGVISLDATRLQVVDTAVWLGEGYLQTLHLSNGARLSIDRNAQLHLIYEILFVNKDGTALLENRGTIVINTPEVVIFQTRLMNAGTIALMGRTQTRFDHHSENYGTINVGRNATLRVASHLAMPSSKLVCLGTLEAYKEGSKFTGSLSVSNIVISGGSMEVQPQSGTSLTIANITVTKGSLLFAAAQGSVLKATMVRIDGGILTTAIPTNYDTLGVHSGTVSTGSLSQIKKFEFLGGTITGTSGHGRYRIENVNISSLSSKSIQRIMVSVSGHAQWVDDEWGWLSFHHGGKLNISKNAEFAIRGRITFEGSPSEYFINEGNVKVHSEMNKAEQESYLVMNPHLINSGLMSCEGNTDISILGGLSQSGSIRVPNNRTVTYKGTLQREEGNLEGGSLIVKAPGRLVLNSLDNIQHIEVQSGAVLTITKSKTNTKALSAQDITVYGTLFLEADLNAEKLVIESGSIRGNHSLSVQNLEVRLRSNLNGVRMRAESVLGHLDTLSMDGGSILYVAKKAEFLTYSHITMSQNSSFHIGKGATMNVRKWLQIERKSADKTNTTFVNEGTMLLASSLVSLLDFHNIGTLTSKEQGDVSLETPTNTTAKPVKGTYIIQGKRTTLTFTGKGAVELSEQSSFASSSSVTISGGSVTMDASQSSLTPGPTGINMKVSGGTLHLGNSTAAAKSGVKFQLLQVTDAASVVTVSPTVAVDALALFKGRIDGKSLMTDHFTWYGGTLSVDDLTVERLSLFSTWTKTLEGGALKLTGDNDHDPGISIAMTVRPGAELVVAETARWRWSSGISFNGGGLVKNEGSIALNVISTGQVGYLDTKYSQSSSANLTIHNRNTLHFLRSADIAGKVMVKDHGKILVTQNSNSEVGRPGLDKVTFSSSSVVEGSRASLQIAKGALLKVESANVQFAWITALGNLTMSASSCSSVVTLDGGMVHLKATHSIGYLRFLSGIFEVAGTAAVNGPTDWTSGLVQVNSGATFYLNGPVKKGPTARETVSGTMSQLPSDASCSKLKACTSCAADSTCSWNGNSNTCVPNNRQVVSSCQVTTCPSGSSCFNYRIADTCNSNSACTWCPALDACAAKTSCPTSPSSTIYWINPAGGNWNDAKNWAGGVVPSNTKDVVIGLSGNYRVTTSGNVVIKSLTIGNNCSEENSAMKKECIGQPVFRINHAVRVSGSVTVLQTGVLEIHSDFTSSGTVRVYGKVIWYRFRIGAATIENYGEFDMRATYYRYYELNSNFINYGMTYYRNAQSGLTIKNGMTFTNKISGRFVFASRHSLARSGTFLNDGMFIMHCEGCSPSVSATFTNKGTVNVLRGSLTFNWMTNWHGNLSAKTGQIYLQNTQMHHFHPSSRVMQVSDLHMNGNNGRVKVESMNFRPSSLHVSSTVSIELLQNITVDSLSFSSYSGKGFSGSGSLTVKQVTKWYSGMFKISETRLEGKIYLPRPRYPRQVYNKLAIAGNVFAWDLYQNIIMLGKQATMSIEKDAALLVTNDKTLSIQLSSCTSCELHVHGDIEVSRSSVFDCRVPTTFYGKVDIHGGSNVQVHVQSRFARGSLQIGKSSSLNFYGSSYQHVIDNDVKLSWDGTVYVNAKSLVINSTDLGPQGQIGTIRVNGRNCIAQFTPFTPVRTVGLLRTENYAHVSLESAATGGVNIDEIRIYRNGGVILNTHTQTTRMSFVDSGSTLYLNGTYKHNVTRALSSNYGEIRKTGDGNEEAALDLYGTMMMSNKFSVRNTILNNFGTVLFRKKPFGIYDNGKLVNHKDGKIVMSGTQLTCSRACSAENHGTIDVTSATVYIDVPFLNSGSVNIKKGQLQLRHNSNNTGSYNVFQKQSLVFTGRDVKHYVPGHSSLHLAEDSEVRLISNSNERTHLYLNQSNLYLPRLFIQSGSVFLASGASAHARVGHLGIYHTYSRVHLQCQYFVVDRLDFNAGVLYGEGAEIDVKKLLRSFTSHYNVQFYNATLNIYGRMLTYTSSRGNFYMDGILKIFKGATLEHRSSNRMKGDYNRYKSEHGIYNMGTIRLPAFVTYYYDIPLHNSGEMFINGTLVMNNGGKSESGSMFFNEVGQLHMTAGSSVINQTLMKGSGKILLKGGAATLSWQRDPATEIELIFNAGTHSLLYKDDPHMVQYISGSHPYSQTVLNILSQGGDVFIDTVLLASRSTLNIQSDGNNQIKELTLRGSYARFDGTKNASVTEGLHWFQGDIRGQREVNINKQFTCYQSTQCALYDATLNLLDDAFIVGPPGRRFYLGNARINVLANLMIENGRDFAITGRNHVKTKIVNNGTIVIDAYGERVNFNFHLDNNGKILVQEGSLGTSQANHSGQVECKTDSKLFQYTSKSIFMDKSKLACPKSDINLYSNGRVEFKGDDVAIKSITGTKGHVLVQSPKGLSVDSLVINPSFTFESSSLTQIGSLRLVGGTLSGNGNALVNGLMDWASGAITIGEGLELQQGPNREVQTFLFNSSSGLITNGVTKISGTSSKTITNGTFFNKGSLYFQRAASLVLRKNAVMVNRNAMYADTSMSVTSERDCRFINHGQVIVQLGSEDTLAKIHVHYENNGSIQVQSGTLQLYTDSRSWLQSDTSGHLDVYSVGVVEYVGGKHRFLPDSVLTVYGTLRTAGIYYQNPVIDIYSSKSDIVITQLVLKAATINIHVPHTFAEIKEVTITSGRLRTMQSVKMGMVQISGGEFVLDKHADIRTLRQGGGTIRASKGQCVIRADHYQWSGGKLLTQWLVRFNVVVQKSMTIFGTQHKYMENQVITTLNGKGTFVSQGYLYLSKNAQLNVNRTGALLFYGGQITVQRNPPGILSNLGNMTIGAHRSASIVAVLKVPVQNQGNITVFYGSLQLNAGGDTTAGDIDLHGGSNLVLAGGVLTSSPAILHSDGNILTKGGLLRLVTGNLQKNITISSGTVEISDPDPSSAKMSTVTLTGSITVAGGKLNVSAVLVNQGKIRLTSGEILGSGHLVNAENGSMVLGDSADTGSRTISLTTVSNLGNIEITSVVGIATGSTMRNEESGTFTLMRFATLVGGGVLRNVGSIVTNVYPDILAKISLKLQNYWKVTPKRGKLLLEASSGNRLQNQLQGHMTGPFIVRGLALISGTITGVTHLEGIIAVMQPINMTGTVIWRSGAFQLDTAWCRHSSYNPPHSIVIASCPVSYVLNVGLLNISASSSVRTFNDGVRFINRGRVVWEGGAVILYRATFTNTRDGHFSVYGMGDHTWNVNRYGKLDNQGTFIVNNTKVTFHSQNVLSNFNNMQVLGSSLLTSPQLVQMGSGSRTSFSKMSTLRITKFTLKEGHLLGSGIIDGSLTCERGEVYPGGGIAGNLTITKSLTLQENATLSIDIRDSAIYDSVIMTNSAMSLQLGGKVRVFWDKASYTPKINDAFDIIQYKGKHTGSFKVIETQETSVVFNATYLSSGVRLTIISV